MVFSRRRFLCGATAMGLSMPLLMRALEARAAASKTVLVVVELNGGNDGFNAVIPVNQYGAYSDLRPNIALAEADLAATMFDSSYATPANRSTQYAFHPRMTALRELWGTGNVAVLAGIGIPTTAYGNTDHEQARFAWSTGTIDAFDITETGWVGGAFDQIGQGGKLPAMIALDDDLPTIMLAKKGSPLVINQDIAGFVPDTGVWNQSNDGELRLADLNANDAYAFASVPGEFARTTAADTEEYVSAVQAVLAAKPLNDYVTQYDFDAGSPQYSGVKTQLEQVARVLLAGSTSRAFWVSQGGYDTHGDQISVQGPLLGELSEGIAQFYAYMQKASAAIADNVVVMTISDFGRRANSNSTAGTDHGTSTVGFVVGARVKGGLYGAYPSFKKLDDNGNVLVPVDFRNQISDICQALGADPTLIVGKTYPKLGFI